MGMKTDLRVSVVLVEKVKATEGGEDWKYCVEGKDKDMEAKARS